MIDPGAARLAVVVSPDSGSLQDAAVAIAEGWASRHSDTRIVPAIRAEEWPFTYPLAVEVPSTPAIVWMPSAHRAFVNHQTAGTRLVTTQASYLMQAWLDRMAGRDVLLLATADRASLEQHAPDILARRGPFARAFILDASEPLPPETGTGTSHLALGIAPGPADLAPGTSAALALLGRAYRATGPSERLAMCIRALEQGRSPGALVATASACMEVNDLDAAARDLYEALGQAPDWPAAHFERGKLWLRLDEMERASESFQAAATRMPGFASAWANLGAVLGELDRPGEALRAFEQALKCDPTSYQALNNVGVVNRELGKLADSETAFRRVTELAPDLAFGYYNLGHTLFLQGRYQAALGAYLEGQKRDAERNPVQASRVALCRLATGDASGALRELQSATGGLPRDYRRQLLADTNAIAWALLTHRPDLQGWNRVNEWLSSELARL